MFPPLDNLLNPPQSLPATEPSSVQLIPAPLPADIKDLLEKFLAILRPGDVVPTLLTGLSTTFT